MNAINFRIGNIVERNMHNGLRAGRSWDILSGLDIYNLSKDPKFDNISTIILTEQWLLKFGFEKQYYGHEPNYYVLNGFEIENDSRNNEFIWFNDFKFVKINHVHQLQNLYFALAGEELIFTK